MLSGLTPAHGHCAALDGECYGLAIQQSSPMSTALLATQHAAIHIQKQVAVKTVILLSGLTITSATNATKSLHGRQTMRSETSFLASGAPK